MAKKEDRGLEKGLEKRKATIRDYKAVFSSEAGKRVLWDLFKTTEFIDSSFVPGDPYSSAFKEGRRNVITYIVRKLKFDPIRLEKTIEEGYNYDLEEYVDDPRTITG